MKESTKTLILVAAAGLVAVVAWAARPSAPQIDPESEIGKLLTPDFSDPLEVTGMEIVDFDEETSEPRVFKVAEVDGLWSLPSRYNYPADADKQLANAASSLIDLEVLFAEPIRPADRQLYGVVDPSDAKVGSVGVGKKVVLTDQNGQKLLDLIIGKEVKGQAGLRYVSMPGRDVVYRVAIDPSKLTTRFTDWIEDDLLKLNGWDIARVIVDDYSIDERTGKRVQGEIVRLTYDDAEAQWKMEGQTEGEELNTEKLNEMKNALDELKIVDVRRKPAGLSRDLRTEEGIQLDQQTLLSLASRGFYFLQDGYLHSNEGEAIVTTKDGVEYVLRFGEIAMNTEEEEASAAGEAENAETDAAADEGAEAEKKSTGPNRYLFVTAAFNRDIIPKPELTPLPDAPAEREASGEEAEGETPAEEQPAEESTPDDAPSESEAGADEAGADEAVEEEAADEEAAAERERIEQENQRKQNEYEEKIKQGEEKVKELNDRFADWYYVISNDVFNKIHLHREDVVKQPEPSGEGDTPQDLDQLRQGLPAADEAMPDDDVPAAPEEAEATPEAEEEPPADEPADESSEETPPAEDEPTESPTEPEAEPAEEESASETAPE